ncbi:hypothetical protein DES37_104141 [Mangrovibacter plantisponsor]|uniref:Uncharacterized protein n=1 Tax=Mangrovibacter plantisponsor TaxID=451513 RepID=A0A317Q2I6_9ENTR|nr:hypothetical protein DES37_104141 [Mangrovibacter plantisponsor]
MLSILAISCPCIDVPGVTEGVNGEAHFTALVVDNSLDFTQVVLELLTRLRLEAYGLFGRTQGSFGMHILTQRGAAAVITLLYVAITQTGKSVYESGSTFPRESTWAGKGGAVI